MTYLALGDSVSIDDYTEVKGGGAASQLARLLEAESFVDMTRDGTMSEGLLARDLGDLPRADCVTLTIGGNDLLVGFFERAVGDRSVAGPQALGGLFRNLERIGDRLAEMGCPVVVNTIYDPTDGDDAKAAELGLVPEARQGLAETNRTIVRLAAERGFLLCDLEALFRGSRVLVRRSLAGDAHRAESQGGDGDRAGVVRPAKIRHGFVGQSINCDRLQRRRSR